MQYNQVKQQIFCSYGNSFKVGDQSFLFNVKAQTKLTDYCCSSWRCAWVTIIVPSQFLYIYVYIFKNAVFCSYFGVYLVSLFKKLVFFPSVSLPLAGFVNSQHRLKHCAFHYIQRPVFQFPSRSSLFTCLHLVKYDIFFRFYGVSGRCAFGDYLFRLNYCFQHLFSLASQVLSLVITSKVFWEHF